MDLNLVRTFLVVAETQSYTKAADKMNLTQPAISSAIKRLETDYGQALFVKRGRGIELTTKGLQLIPKFQQALDIIDNAMHMREHFNVYCNESLLHCLLPMENIAFTESPPEKHRAFEHLRQQKADLVIDNILTKDNAFVIEEIYKDPVVVICRKAHPRIQNSITKYQFYQEQHVLYSGTWESLRGFEQIAREPVEERKVAVISGSIAGVTMHVSQSDALAFVPFIFAQKWADILDLQILECPIDTDLAPYHLVYHKREARNPAHKALREKIKQALAKFKYPDIKHDESAQ